MNNPLDIYDKLNKIINIDLIRDKESIIKNISFVKSYRSVQLHYIPNLGYKLNKEKKGGNESIVYVFT